MPEVALLIAFSCASVWASLTVIVITSVEAVVKAARLAAEAGARVAVTTPVVAAAIASNCGMDGASLRVTAPV